MYWNPIWNCPGIIPFGYNLTHFGATPDIPDVRLHQTFQCDVITGWSDGVNSGSDPPCLCRINLGFSSLVHFSRRTKLSLLTTFLFKVPVLTCFGPNRLSLCSPLILTLIDRKYEWECLCLFYNIWPWILNMIDARFVNFINLGQYHN